MDRLPMRHRWLSFLLMACFAHAPVPWFHRHTDLEPGTLQRHLATFHPGNSRAVEPDRGHWHVFLLGANLAGTPCQTNDEDRSSGSDHEAPLKEFPWSALPGANELSDLEARGNVFQLLPATAALGNSPADRPRYHLHAAIGSSACTPLGQFPQAAYQAHLCVWRL